MNSLWFLISIFRHITCHIGVGKSLSLSYSKLWDMSDFNITLNSHDYLALFVSKTLFVVWYFIMDLIPSKFHSYLALFESKSMIIFICFHCLTIFFKLCKITQTLSTAFSSPNLNSYLVFHYWNTCSEICFNYSFYYFIYLRLVITL